MKLTRLFNIKSAALILSFAIILTSCDKPDVPQNTGGENMAQNSAKELPARSDIDNKYKWNLEDFYKTIDEWQNDFDLVTKQIPELAKLKGTMSKSAKDMYNVIKSIEDAEKIAYKVYFYASSARDLDISNGEASTRHTKVQKLLSDFSTSVSWYGPELMAMSAKKINSFIASNKDLKAYEFAIEKSLRMKAHTLSAEKEELMAKLYPIGQTTTTTYSILNNAELDFPIVKDPNGNEMRISHGLYRSTMYDKNRDFRKNVYNGVYKPYNQLIGTYASLYNGRVKERIIKSQIRGYDSPLQSALFGNNVPVSVYENLIETAHQHINVLHRWAKIKKSVLGYDELHPYDTYVSLFPGVNKSYEFDDAAALVLKSLEPLGKEYVDAVKHSIDNRWIDVYETQGKRSGAYSNSCMSGHPLILLNWNNTLDDMFTLAHEIGHNMHSFFSEKYQPYHYGDYPIFIAEVASITNEALLLDYMIKNAESKEEKMFLIEKFLANTQGTFFRQVRFAEFEKIMHDKAQAGEFLSSEQMNELFLKLYKEYWGEAMTADDNEGTSWARVHHLTMYNFYVYQYATGFAAANALSELMIANGKPAVEQYLTNFIHAGNSDYPLNILKKAGVDMSTPAPIIKTLEKANKYIDELEALMNEK